MSKPYYFFKNGPWGGLGDNTFSTLWDLLESWVFQNEWMSVFFIIVLGIIFEIILIKICASLKKPVLSEKGSSGSQENEDSCLKSMKFALENQSVIYPSSEERVDILTKRRITSTLTSEENEDEFEGRILSSGEKIWAGTSESEYHISHFCESHMPSSDETRSSLSLFHSEAREIFLNHKEHPENEYETIQFSSKKLFSIMKANKNKKSGCSSNRNFPKTSKFTAENKDLTVAPCPPAHLFLSRDQVKLLEENVRNQISLKPKATLESETNYLCPRSQESFNQNQYSVEMVISTQAQDLFPGQNTIWNQGFYEAQFTSQAQQFIHSQESVNSQPNIKASYFAQPQDVIRKPLSSSTQDSFRAQNMDRSQHYIKTPYIFETQDSIKGLESDEHLGEAQYSVCFKDSNKIKYSVKGQNSVFKNAEFLALTLSLNSVAEDMPQLSRILPKGQQQVASSELTQSLYRSRPLSRTIKVQKNRRKTRDSKSKLSLKGPSLKAKKTLMSQVFKIIVCHTSKNRNKLGFKNNIERKELHQSKRIPNTALHLFSISTLTTPYIKKYSRKTPVNVIPRLIKCGYFLQRQNKSPDIEKIDYTGSLERGISGIPKNVKLCDRENKGLGSISLKMLPQREWSFMVNNDELKAPCLLLETNWKNRESPKDPIKQTFDPCIPKHEMLPEEAMQKLVSSPKMKSNKGMKIQEDLQTKDNGEELPTSTRDVQRYFPKENTQKPKDLLEIVLGTKKHESNEESEMKIQVSTESVNLKEKKPSIPNITEYGNLNESEELDPNTRSNIKNMHQDKMIPDTFHSATQSPTSEPPSVEIHRRLKAKTGTSAITRLCHLALEQEILPDEEEIKLIDKSSVFKKPQEYDREEEEREAVLPLTQDFRFIVYKKQKPKYVKFEMEEISSESRKTKTKEQEIQPQTLLGTSSCPMTDPLQIEKGKQNTYRPTGRESVVGPVNPLTMSENLPAGEYLIETTECGIPFDGNPRKTLDGRNAEEKEDLKRDLPAIGMRSFEIRKKLSGTKNVLSIKHVIMKVKKPAVSPMLRINRRDTPSHRKKLGDNFEIIIKQMLQDKNLAAVLLNIYPHMSVLPNTRVHTRLNAENCRRIKPTQEKSQVRREEKHSDFLNKENKSPNTLEVKLQDEMKGVKDAPPKAIPHDGRNVRTDAHPGEEVKTEKEVYQPIPLTETAKESMDTSMDPSQVSHVKKNMSTQTDFQCTADSEVAPPISGKSLMGDPLHQTRESNGPRNGSDTMEIGYCFAEKRAELPKDLLAPSPETGQRYGQNMTVLSCSKRKKNRVRFADTTCTRKPSVSQTFSITGHRNKLELDLKTKIKKINQAKGLAPECLHRLEGVFCHAQLKQGEPASKAYVDVFTKGNAFHNREEKYQGEEEGEQKAFLEAAPQHSQHLCPDACQMNEIHLHESHPSLICLTQEQPNNEQGVQHQTGFPQTALGDSLKMDPIEAEELQKTNNRENDIKVPVGPKIPSPKAGNSSFNELMNTTECSLASSRNSKRELDSCLVEKNSEMPADLQVTSLQSSDSIIMPFVPKSKSKRQRKALRLARKQKAVCSRHRTMREIKPSISHMLNGRDSKKQQSNIKMKIRDPQQRNNVADAFLDITHSKMPVLPNIKMRRNLNVETDMQKIRLGHMQLMQEKSPNGQAYCPDSMDGRSFSSMVKYGKEEEEEPEALQVSENSHGVIFKAYQKKDLDDVKTDKELNQPGSTNIQVRPQTRVTQAVWGSTSCPLLDQFQLEKLESCFRFSLLEPGKVMVDAFSSREGGAPSDGSDHKEQASGSENKRTVAFDFYIPTLSTSERKKNWKQFSDMKTSVNPRCRIMKAKKPSISYMLNTKGGANPNRRKKLGCDLITKMKAMHQGKRGADTKYPLTAVTPDITLYSKIEREKRTPREKRRSSTQVKQEVPPQEGNITSDDIKETYLRDEEEEDCEKEPLLKILPQYSQHFVFCSGQKKDLNLHQLEKQGSRKILFVTEQDVSEQVQPACPVRGEGSKQSLQTQNGTRSVPAPLNSEESQTDEVSTGTTKSPALADGNHAEELRSWDKKEKAGLESDLQATVPASLNPPTDLPESKRQSGTFTGTALKSKISPTCGITKARKASISKIFSIPQYGCRKNVPPKALKSQVVEHLMCSGVPSDGFQMIVPENPIAEKKKDLAQEISATILESWDFSTLDLPACKRERDNLEFMDKGHKMSPTRVTLKAKKALISQTFNITGCGPLSHRKQLKCNSQTKVKRGKPVADIFLNAISSPMPMSLNMKVCNRIKKTDTPCQIRFSHELQQQEQSAREESAWCAHSVEDTTSNGPEDVKDPSGEEGPLTSQHFAFIAQKMKEPNFVRSNIEMKNSATHPESEKSPHDEEAQVSWNNMQSRSSNVMKMNVQHEKTEKSVQKMSSESVPHCSQHFGFPVHQVKDLGSLQLESDLKNSKGGRTGDLSCTGQETKQTHLRETIKKSPHLQEVINSMVGLKTPFPKAEESEIGFPPGDIPWDGNPRRKWDTPLYDKKVWNQKDLRAAALKPLDFASLVSSESESESYTLEFVDKKSIMSPKHVTLKAKQPPVSKLLNITMYPAGGHRKKKQNNIKYQGRGTQWCVSVGEALLSATEGAKSPPPTLMTDRLSFDTTGGPRSKRTHQKILGPEEKAELQENIATTFLGPSDFFMPVLSDSKSQVNTVQLSEHEITLNPRCLTMKEKKPPISQILKVDGHFTIKHRKKSESNLRTKMKAMWQSKNVTETFTHITYLTSDTSDVKRQKEFKAEIAMRVSRFSRAQLAQVESPVEGSARYFDPTDKGGTSDFLKEVKLHDGESRGEKQEPLIESGPFYIENLVSEHLAKEPDPGRSEGMLLGESFPRKSQIYVGNSEINVKVGKANNVQINLQVGLSKMEKLHICAELNEPVGDALSSKCDDKVDHSVLKEKSPCHLAGIIDSVGRHLPDSEIKNQTGSLKTPDTSSPKDTPSQVKQSVVLQSLNAVGHASVSINENQNFEAQKIKIERDKAVLNAEIKSIHASMPIPEHMKVERLSSMWHTYGKSSEKRNALNEAKVREKEEDGKQVLFRTATQNIQPFEFGGDQVREPGPFKLEASLINTMGPKNITPKKPDIYLIDQETKRKVVAEFSPDSVFNSEIYPLQIEKQSKEFKTTSWKTINPKTLALQKKQHQPYILEAIRSSPYASIPMCPKIIRHNNKAQTVDMKSTLHTKQVKLKTKETVVSQLIGDGTGSNKKELRCNIQEQKAFQTSKNAANLVQKATLDSGCLTSHTDKLTEIKVEKERKSILPQLKLEKPLNERQIWSGCVNVSGVIGKLEENITEEGQDYQSILVDISQQHMQPVWVGSQQMKERPVKSEDLQRKLCSEPISQKDETAYIRFAIPRSRRGSEVHNEGQDTWQQKFSLKRGMWKLEMIPETSEESISFPMKEPPHFKRTKEFITKQDLKPSIPERRKGLEVTKSPSGLKEQLLTPGLMAQPQNPFTGTLLESASSHILDQTHAGKLKEEVKTKGIVLKGSTQQVKKISNSISNMEHMPRNTERLLLLIKEQEKRRKKIRKDKKFEIAIDMKITVNSSPVLNYSPAGVQFASPLENVGMFSQRDGTELSRSTATLWGQQRLCGPGAILDSVHTHMLASPEVISHKGKGRAAFMKSALCPKRIKMKVKKEPIFQLLSITETRSNKKQLRCNIKQQKTELQDKTVADLMLNDTCDSGYIPSQIKGIIEVKKEKDKPQKPIHIPPQPKLKKSLNKRKMSSSQSADKSAVSGTISRPKQYITEQEEEVQIVLPDILPQDRDQLRIRQQVEKTPDHVKLKADLEAGCVIFPERTEVSYSRLDTPRMRVDTELGFLIAQTVKQGVVDVAEHSVSFPQRREGSKKIDISSSSKGQNIFLIELDTFQQKTCREQELLKQESISMTDLGSVTCHVREPLHLENTGEVAREGDVYTNRKNISHLLGREGLNKTDIFIGSKGQKFLCTNLEGLHKTCATQRGHVKPGHRPRSVLGSVPCPSRDPLHFKQAVNTTRKESDSISVSVNIRPWGKEQSELTDNPLKSNRQKVDFSKKLRANQLNICNLNKEKILESIVSCIFHQLHSENAKKQISAKATLSSKGFNLAIEKASSEGSIAADQSPCTKGVNLHSKGRKEYRQSTCKAFPTSVTHPLMNIQLITSSRIKKALRTFNSPGNHTLKTEEEDQKEKCLYKALPKPASHFETDLLQINTPMQQVKLDSADIMHDDYSTPRPREALKQVDGIDRYTQKRKKRRKWHCLSISYENVEKHTFFSQNYPCLQPHFVSQTKEALSEVDNESSSTKGLDLFSKAQLSTIYEHGLEWTVPSITPRQMKKQNTVLSLESCSETIKYPNLLFSKEKQLSTGAQLIESVSNGSSPRLRGRQKVESHKANHMKQKEICLPRIFLHSLSICMHLLHENQRHKGSTKQGLMKGIICPERRALKLKKSLFSHVANDTNYDTPSNTVPLQWNIKEKMINMKHRQGESDLVATEICKPIPSLPHLMDKETTDGFISNTVKRAKQHTSQEEKDSTKAVEMKGIMDSDITLKIEKSSLSHVLKGKELPLQLDLTKQESKVQEGTSKSDVKLTNSCTSFLCLSHPNLNSRTEVGKEKSGILRSCLPPLKPQASSEVRKISFAEAAHRDSLNSVVELKHLPLRKKEYRENTKAVKDIMGLMCVTLEGKKSPFKQLLYGEEPQWSNKRREKMMLDNKKNRDVAQNKLWDSIRPSSHKRWDPTIIEVYMQGITRFCLPSLTLQELSGAMGMYDESNDNILISIKRANHIPQKDRMEIASEEIMHSERIALKTKQSAVLQELRLNVEEKEEKVREGEQAEIRSNSSTFSPPYSEVDTEIKPEEDMQIKTRSSFLQPKLRESSDIGEMAPEESTSGSVLNSVKNAIEHTMQEEEGVKMEKVTPVKEKKSSVSQEIQLDIKDQEKQLQKIKDEPNAFVTNTSTGIPSPSHLKLDTGRETEVTRYSLPKLSHQESPNVVKKAAEESTEGNITCDVQKVKEYMPQKEGDKGKISAENYIMYPKDKDLKEIKAFSQALPLNSQAHTIEQGETDPQNKQQEKTDGEDKKQEKGNPDGKEPGEMNGEGEEQRQVGAEVHELGKVDEKGKEQGKVDLEGQEQGKQDQESQEQENWDQDNKKQGEVDSEGKEQEKTDAEGKELEKAEGEGQEQGKVGPEQGGGEEEGEEDEGEGGGEPGVIKTCLASPVPQESSPTGHITPTESIASHVKKTEYLPQKEDRVQTLAVNDLVHPRGPVFKAETSVPPHMFSISEHSTLDKRKEPQWSGKEKVGQKQERTSDPDVVVTKTDPSMPYSSHHTFSPSQVKLPVSSGAGKITHADSKEGISSPTVPLKACQQRPYEEANDGVKTEDTEDRILPKTITGRAEIPPPAHLHDRKKLPLNVKELRKKAQEGKTERGMVLKETAPSPSPTSSLKWDTRMSEKGSTLGGTQFCLLPLKMQDASESRKKANTESSDGYVLSNRKGPTQSVTQKEEKGRFKIDMKDKNIPRYMDLKVRKLQISHTLSNVKLQKRFKEQKGMMQEDKSELFIDMANRITEMSLSLLQSEKSSDADRAACPGTIDGELSSDVKELKEYMLQKEKNKEKVVGMNGVVDPKDISLKTKKSPVLYTDNLSDCLWKTREQEEKIPEDKSDPGIMLTKISTEKCSPPFLNVNTGTEEESTPVLTRSSFSTVNFQESSDSEGGIPIKPMTDDRLLSLQNENQHMPEKKEEDGVQMVKVIMFPKHQEIKVQECKDEPGVVLAKSSTSLPSVLHLKLDKEIELEDDTPRLTESALQRNAGETALAESTGDDIMRDVKKRHMPHIEKTGKKETLSRRGIAITLKSWKSPPPCMLHRTELHLDIKGHKQKEREIQGGPQGKILKQIYTSTFFLPNLRPDESTQVDGERLGSQTSLPPLMLSAFSDAKNTADTEVMSSDVRNRKYIAQKEKRYEVKTVDMTIGVHCRNARISPISHILNTKEFVLNIKVLEKKGHKDKDEPCVVLTRTFLSLPSAPLFYLDSGNKTDEDTTSITGSPCTQQNLQESSDAQETANGESVEGDRKNIFKGAEYSVPQKEAEQQWTSNITVNAQQRNEHIPVKSERDLNLQDENVSSTGFGTIRSGEIMELHFTGQKDQPEKPKKDSLATFHSSPTMCAIGNLKKETEVIGNLKHEISPKVSVSLPRKISKEICVTSGTPLSSGGVSLAERDVHQQETSSEVSLGSVSPCKLDKPEKDVQSNDKMSKMFSPREDRENREEQDIIMKKQVMPQSESSHKTRSNSILSLKFPLQNGNQRTPLEIDVDRKNTAHPSLQILPRMHMDITEFNAVRGKEDPALFVPKQEECVLELLQKSNNPPWTFLLQSEHLEEKDEPITNSAINLQQKKLEMNNNRTMKQGGKLKIDTNRAIYLEEDKIEMHKNSSVDLEKDKIGMDMSSTINLHALSPGTEESWIETHIITHLENNCPVKQKQKKELELPSAKQDIQVQKSLQRNALGSFYAYLPVSLKGQEDRLTITDLKRELSPKYLAKHPILQILGITGHDTPRNRMKLEYGLNKPKNMVLWHGDASGIFIRSLSVTMASQPCKEETAASEANLGREKRASLSNFQKNSPSASEIVKSDTLTIVKGELNFINTVPQDSQPLVVNDHQMQRLPHVKSEANLQSEIIKKNLTPQTRERTVPGHDDLNIIKKPDLHMIEQEEKLPECVLTPTEHAFMSEDPKEIVETHMKSLPSLGVEEPQCGIQLFDTTEYSLLPKQRDQGEPVGDTAPQKVQQEKAFPGTVPVPPEVKSNESKVPADGTRAERLLPTHEAITTAFEAQVGNVIQDKVLSEKLGKVQAYEPHDLKSPPFLEGPDTSSSTEYPTLQHQHILNCFTPEEKNKLTNHLESKALEMKLNLIPEMAKISLQKFNLYPKGVISEDDSWRLYLRHKNVSFMSPEGVDTKELNLKYNYQKESPPLVCVKTLNVNVSGGSKEVITKLKTIQKQGSEKSSVTSASEIPLTPVLQNYSVKEKDRLLMHLSMKTLEVQMKALPRIVRESCAVVNTQDRTKPLSNCIHSAVKVPKRKNRIVLPFEEKSLHHIDLDLQYKYLHFLLGLSGESMFPQPNAFPKHILNLNTISVCKKVDDSGENCTLSFDTELLERHISFKKQSPPEDTLPFRTFQEPNHVRAFDPGLHGVLQKGTRVLSELKSHVTPKKDEQYHACFQGANTNKPVDLGTQENATGLVGSHSTQISDCFPDSQINTESSAKLEDCPAPEADDSEECMFLEANLHLSRESQNILIELQKGIPLENFYKVKETTYLKPFYSEDSDIHRIKGCKKHTLLTTPPACESHKSRRGRSSSKMQCPHGLCRSSPNAVETESTSSSMSFSEEKLSWTQRSRTTSTDSSTKLHLAKNHSKSHVRPEGKEKKKAKFDLFRKRSVHQDYDYGHTHSREKWTGKKKVCDYESERSYYSRSRHRSASKPHQEESSLHSERKQSQPFFYACTPADSPGVRPQTIRWTIPPKTLRKRNFRVPLVAKTSHSWNIWRSSKELLGSCSGSVSTVHQS